MASSASEGCSRASSASEGCSMASSASEGCSRASSTSEGCSRAAARKRKQRESTDEEVKKMKRMEDCQRKRSSRLRDN